MRRIWKLHTGFFHPSGSIISITSNPIWKLTQEFFFTFDGNFRSSLRKVFTTFNLNRQKISCSHPNEKLTFNHSSWWPELTSADGHSYHWMQTYVFWFFRFARWLQPHRQSFSNTHHEHMNSILHSLYWKPSILLPLPLDHR